MTNQGDESRKEDNIKAVRTYLMKEFPGFGVTEQSDSRSGGAWTAYTFTTRKDNIIYKLRISRPRLTDFEYTPEKITLLLQQGKVSEEMKKNKGELFDWA